MKIKNNKKNAEKCTGLHPNIWGDFRNITGNVSGVTGEVSEKLSGDMTGVMGSATGAVGKISNGWIKVSYYFGSNKPHTNYFNWNS